jgi:hypothetical protein
VDKPTQRLSKDDLNQDDRQGVADPPIRCADCGGDTIWAEVIAPTTTIVEPIVLRTRIFISKGRFGTDIYRTNMTACKARVCLSCGLVKFYAEHPHELTKEW